MGLEKKLNTLIFKTVFKSKGKKHIVQEVRCLF